MRTICSHSSPAAAILTLAQIKATIDAFDRGDANVFDALDGIIDAVEAYRTANAVKPNRRRTRREAA